MGHYGAGRGSARGGKGQEPPWHGAPWNKVGAPWSIPSKAAEKRVQTARRDESSLCARVAREGQQQRGPGERGLLRALFQEFAIVSAPSQPPQEPAPLQRPGGSGTAQGRKVLRGKPSCQQPPSPPSSELALPAQPQAREGAGSSDAAPGGGWGTNTPLHPQPAASRSLGTRLGEALSQGCSGPPGAPQNPRIRPWGSVGPCHQWGCRLPVPMASPALPGGPYPLPLLLWLHKIDPMPTPAARAPAASSHSHLHPPMSLPLPPASPILVTPPYLQTCLSCSR